MISITAIPAFNDNYFWLLSQDKMAVVVDPGDAAPVVEHLKSNQLILSGILITHHHADHVGGVKQLKQLYQCPVWGPKNDPVEHLDFECEQDDVIHIAALSLDLKVLEVGGHTKGHIAYFAEQTAAIDNSLFCGDTLFSGGCGRLFEGTPSQMWQSMKKILALPDSTLLYPAHEYTLANLTFAQNVEPGNQALSNYLDKVKRLRQQNQPSLPALLSVERAINPFLRVEQASVKQAAAQYTDNNLANNSTYTKDGNKLSAEQTFAIIRRWKDVF
jgi:hydroxyacylglutathione hydrolase